MMETLAEATRRLRDAGYTLDLTAVPGARLHCPACDLDFPADDFHIDEIVRFEGASDPDDETILVAVADPQGHRGLYTAAFGPDTPPADAAALRALHR